jgi:hypothetical protein
VMSETALAAPSPIATRGEAWLFIRHL